MAKLNERERSTVRQVAMFSSLEDADIASLVANCGKKSFRPHETICREGEPATCFFVILQGHVRVFKLAASGDQQVLHIFGPGQSFTEAAAMKGMPYPAYAEALDAATILTIDKTTFDAALRQNVEMVAGLVAGLSSKLKELADLAERLSLKSVPARVACVLLEESRSADNLVFKLSTSKKQLADRIGTTPETLSRTLKTFCQEGVIQMDASRITIRNESRLADLAAGG